MRDLTKTLLTSGMLAATALLVAACGGSQPAESTDNSAEMTDMNSTDMGSDMGMANDTTAMDATAGADANMSMDANATAMGNAVGDAMANAADAPAAAGNAM
jgi:hypothetical protein